MSNNRTRSKKDNMKRNNWVMDEQEYANIKRMLEIPKLGVAQIASLTGWSDATIWKVRATESLAGYRNYDYAAKQRAIAARKAKQAQQPVEVDSATTSSAVPKLKDIEKSLQERKVLALERMAAAQERLADAWEASPTKRTGIFG